MNADKPTFSKANELYRPRHIHHQSSPSWHPQLCVRESISAVRWCMMIHHVTVPLLVWLLSLSVAARDDSVSQMVSVRLIHYVLSTGSIIFILDPSQTKVPVTNFHRLYAFLSCRMKNETDIAIAIINISYDAAPQFDYQWYQGSERSIPVLCFIESFVWWCTDCT